MYKKLGAVLVLAMTLIFGTSVTAYAQTEGAETENTQENNSTEATEEISLEDNPFSEDGNATLGDSATSEDNKEFITVTTKDGNVFYLIIDHQRDSNNVYFLNMVDESDLAAFLEENSDTGLDSIVSLPAETEPESEIVEETGESEETKGEDVVKEGLDQAQSGSNLNYLMVIVVAGVFGLAYYFKIHKKKQQSSYDEYETEEEYEGDDEYEEETYKEDDLDDREDEDDEEAEREAQEQARQEAERQARLEEERQAKREQERIRKEKLKENQERLKAEERKLDEQQRRLKEEQKRLAQEQNRIREEQEQFETGEDGVF